MRKRNLMLLFSKWTPSRLLLLSACIMVSLFVLSWGIVQAQSDVFTVRQTSNVMLDEGTQWLDAFHPFLDSLTGADPLASLQTKLEFKSPLVDCTVIIYDAGLEYPVLYVPVDAPPSHHAWIGVAVDGRLIEISETYSQVLLRQGGADNSSQIQTSAHVLRVLDQPGEYEVAVIIEDGQGNVEAQSAVFVVYP